MPKVFVTGGAGFIGSNLVDELIKDGHRVVIIDNLSTGKKEYLNSKAKFYKLDIGSKKIEQVFEKEKPDFVFHLAAQIDVRKSLRDPEYDNKINVLGSLNILENCCKSKVKKIIFASTGGAVYGDAREIPTTENYIPAPMCPYGIHKLTFEKYLKYYYEVYKQDYTALRFANIYGPRQYKGGEAGVVAIFIDKAVNNSQSILNGSGQQTRDFVYVDDVVAAFIKSMKVKFPGEINIGTDKETSILEIINSIEKTLERKMIVKKGPAIPGEQKRSCLDSKLAKKVLNWEPKVKLEEGIRRTIEWSENKIINK
ncbi:MAG: NAD-dependent epimerase/dehydratase family protein [Patescibacteria group bacterium]